MMLPTSRVDLGLRPTRHLADVNRDEGLRRESLRPYLGARAVLARSAALCVLACSPMLAGCQYVDKARAANDAVANLSEYYEVEMLVQADLERRRLRKARCYSPLLTPATISAAAADGRLGAGWIDELLSDCPQFAAFLSELTFRRAAGRGLLPALGRAAAEGGGTDQLAVQATMPNPAPAEEP